MVAGRAGPLKRPVRILIVDDHPLMRAGLAARISDEPHLEVCGQVEDAPSALEAVKLTSPHLAIIDLALKKGHGLDLVKDIKTRFPQVRMLVLSAYQESLFAERALRAGAMGYLNKQETGEKIFEAVRTILDGRLYVSAEIAQRLMDQAIGAGSSESGDPVSRLSDRELEVFQLIGRGMTSAAIARELHLSTHTIDTHREKIRHKLGVRNSSALMQRAVEWVLSNG
jgi:DNA-binding NarL/FixJ family response regulator